MPPADADLLAQLLFRRLQLADLLVVLVAVGSKSHIPDLDVLKMVFFSLRIDGVVLRFDC